MLPVGPLTSMDGRQHDASAPARRAVHGVRLGVPRWRDGGADDPAVGELRRLRRQLRQLRNEARQRRRRATLRIEPLCHVQRLAVLMFWLSQDPIVTARWAEVQMHRSVRSGVGARLAVTEHLLRLWSARFITDTRMQRAMHDLNHPWRFQVDCCLVESLVLDDLLARNADGEHVPTSVLATWFCRKWQFRPRCSRGDRLVARLSEDPCYVKEWGRRFRRKWDVRWGKAPASRCLTKASIATRVAIFLRWSDWLLNDALAGKDVVVVNMDETSIGNVPASQHGNVIERKRLGILPDPSERKPPKLPRCSLMAAISSEPSLQKCLPQVLLPKTPAKKKPSLRLTSAISQAGDPVEAWHGSSGFANSLVVRHWLTRVRRKVHRARPQAQLVVAIDMCSTHKGLTVLRHARQLGLAVILVPARMTWLLQPLDSHIFAPLKQRLRRLVALHKAEQRAGGIDLGSYTSLCGQAIQTTLVSRDWSHVMRGSGLAQGPREVRPALLEHVQGLDLAARPPSVQELAEITASSAQNAAIMRTLLVHPWTRPEVTEDRAEKGVDTARSETVTGMPDLRPVVRPAKRSRGSAKAQTAHPAASPAVPAVSAPRGRRLTPCTRNLMLPVACEPPAHGRMATRSQSAELLPGIIATERLTRRNTWSGELASATQAIQGHGASGSRSKPW